MAAAQADINEVNEDPQANLNEVEDDDDDIVESYGITLRESEPHQCVQDEAAHAVCSPGSQLLSKDVHLPSPEEFMNPRQASCHSMVGFKTQRLKDLKLDAYSFWVFFRFWRYCT